MNGRRIQELLEKASQGRGLSAEEAKLFLEQGTDENWVEIFDAARGLTERRFQKTLHFFAPLYFSSFCVNDCAYCGFQRSNTHLNRRVLSEEEFLEEARFLWKEGHRTLLLIAGEHPVYAGVGQVALYLTALRRSGLDFSIMVEVGPLSVEDYGILREMGVNHCLLFQETYDREIYGRVHRGKKKDFDWRFHAMERALAAGIENIGLGILLGLGPWREDLIRLMDHAYGVKERYGCLPATFSFPRLKPAHGVTSFHNHTVSDEAFQKIVAVCRLACPEAGIVLTTREDAGFRRSLLEKGMGVTHMSAGSCTAPGGYTLGAQSFEDGQFELSDHRPLRGVVREAEGLGCRPIFNPEAKNFTRIHTH